MAGTSSPSPRPDSLVDPYLSFVSTFLAEAALDPALAAPLSEWIAAVASWNRRVDLTAARDTDELLDLMLADAIVLAQRLERGRGRRRVVDVGTGAGAPGLPLAILRPDLEVTLIEPLQKRVALLRLAQGKLRKRGLAEGLEVVRGKGEDRAGAERFDLALSRATLPPPEWLELGTRLAPEVVVLLAQGSPPEGEGLVVVDDHRYCWPRTGAERRLVIYRSEA